MLKNIFISLLILISLNSLCYSSIYEMYLKHGKRDQRWNAIIKQGFDQYKQGKYNLAVKGFEVGIKLGCYDGIILYALGMSYKNNNQPNKAKDYLNAAKYKLLYDDFNEKFRGLVSYSLYKLYNDDLNDKANAQKTLDEAIKLNKDVEKLWEKYNKKPVIKKNNNNKTNVVKNNKIEKEVIGKEMEEVHQLVPEKETVIADKETTEDKTQKVTVKGEPEEKVETKTEEDGDVEKEGIIEETIKKEKEYIYVKPEKENIRLHPLPNGRGGKLIGYLFKDVKLEYVKKLGNKINVKLDCWIYEPSVKGNKVISDKENIREHPSPNGRGGQLKGYVFKGTEFEKLEKLGNKLHIILDCWIYEPSTYRK